MLKFSIFLRCLGCIIFSGSILFSPSLLAEQKPFAPEAIQGVKIVSAEEVVELILSQTDLVLIDSRKKTEFQNGHIEGAINLPNTKLTLRDFNKILPNKSTLVLFYCNGIRCLRSSDSIYKVKAWGYTNLIWFRGGWKEWMEKLLPVVKN